MGGESLGTWRAGRLYDLGGLGLGMQTAGRGDSTGEGLGQEAEKRLFLEVSSGAIIPQSGVRQKHSSRG